MGRGKSCREETVLCPGGSETVGGSVVKTQSGGGGGEPEEEEGAPTRVVGTVGCRHRG